MKTYPTTIRSKSSRASNAKGGFTLLEVMMVVVILGVLIGIGVTQFNPKKKMIDVKTAATRAAISQLHQEVVTYEMKHNTYPTSLQAMVDEGVLRKINPDAWGQPYSYNAANGEIISSGGGEGSLSSLDL